MAYNTTSAETVSGLMVQVNGYVGGTMGVGLVLMTWIIAYYSMQQYPNMDALRGSTWVAWLTSMFATILGILTPSFSILLFLIVVALTGYGYSNR